MTQAGRRMEVYRRALTRCERNDAQNRRNEMTHELKPHPLAKWIKAAADGRVVMIRQNGTWDGWHPASLQTLCSINPDGFSVDLATPREWYVVTLGPDRMLVWVNDTRAEAQQWIDASACPEKYEIIHVREAANEIIHVREVAE